MQNTKPQATRCSRMQLAYLAYWQSLGYQFKHDELAPESTSTPPCFATRHPRVTWLACAAADTAVAVAIVGTFLHAAGLI